MGKLGNQFGSRLRLARTLKGWTQQELSMEALTSRQHIHQLESGIKSPSKEVLDAVCESLGVKEDFLLAPLVNPLTAEQCNFRKRKTTKLALANQVVAFGTVVEELVGYLNEYIQFPDEGLADFAASISYKNHSESYSRQDIEEIADNFRDNQLLGLDTPIDNMTELLEGLGVIVTSFEGVSDKVDALSFSRKYNIVLRNTAKESVCRQRFDLAHELGHIILHQGVVTGDGSTEAEADHFASSFLFPRKAFLKEFNYCLTAGGRIRWQDLLLLKQRWKVSQKAIIYRAHSLGIINSRQYRSANIHLSSSGQAKNELLDDELPMEEPSLIGASIELIKDNLGIGFKEISNRLGFDSPSYLAEMLGLNYIEAKERSSITLLPPRQFSN